eukprot:gnl/Hemi2/12463_TR4247_c0_g1_i1.p1 gnl/Hemi2/12463_TR4247_c0_g1~~gnl/Hemi2/12463_TR4247_c0_g1_i1.p1  ORF type:complete len:493 (-),score=103.46 gnl/Hemi2/12463_TR4247_c0_g1_i1:50-1528(-)
MKAACFLLVLGLVATLFGDAAGRKRRESPYFGEECCPGCKAVKLFEDGPDGTKVESPAISQEDLLACTLLGQGDVGLVWAAPKRDVVLKTPVECPVSPFTSPDLLKEAEAADDLAQVLTKLRAAFPAFTTLAATTPLPAKKVYVQLGQRQSSGGLVPLEGQFVPSLIKPYVQGVSYNWLPVGGESPNAALAAKEFFDALVMYESTTGKPMAVRRGDADDVAVKIWDFKLDNIMWGKLDPSEDNHMILIDLQVEMAAATPSFYAETWDTGYKKSGGWRAKFGELTNPFSRELSALRVAEEEAKRLAAEKQKQDRERAEAEAAEKHRKELEALSDEEDEEAAAPPELFVRFTTSFFQDPVLSNTCTPTLLPELPTSLKPMVIPPSPGRFRIIKLPTNPSKDATLQSVFTSIARLVSPQVISDSWKVAIRKHSQSLRGHQWSANAQFLGDTLKVTSWGALMRDYTTRLEDLGISSGLVEWSVSISCSALLAADLD